MPKEKRVLSDDDKMTLLWWQVWRADPKRPLRWVQSLRRSVDMLVTNPTPEVAAVFWVRLYGVIEKVRRRHEPRVEEAEGRSDDDAPADADEFDPHEEQARLQDEYFAELAAA